jgi:RimJ/RimL family protein N-acetyltransferase
MSDVKIRPLSKKDAPIMARLANNKNIFDNLRDGFPYPYTLADAESFIENFKDHSESWIFAIEYHGEYVGNIGLIKQTDVYQKSAELGYFVGEPYWNKGIATKAIQLICDFGFQNLDIVRIHSGIYEYNKASQRVLEKCEFDKEGIFKKAIFKNGKIWDEVRYAKINPGI